VQKLKITKDKKKSSHILVTEFNTPIVPFLPEANQTNHPFDNLSRKENLKIHIKKLEQKRNKRKRESLPHITKGIEVSGKPLASGLNIKRFLSPSSG
jgi:hypothetical protein